MEPLAPRRQLLPLLLSLLAGCATNGGHARLTPLIAAESSTVIERAHASEAVSGPATPLPDGPLSLPQLEAVALARHPELAAAVAKIEVARGKLIQAGLYPNPHVGWESDDLGQPEHGAGKQGPTFEQEIVTGGKLALAQAAAVHGVTAADWQAVTRRFEIITRVRLAFYEVLAAQRELREIEESVAIGERGLKAAETLARTLGSQTDVLRSRIELEQNKLRLAAVQQRDAAAWKLLAVAIGEPELKPRSLAGTFEAPTAVYSWQPVLTTILARSSEIQEAQALIRQTETELGRAYAEVCPNLQIQIHPFYSFPEKEMELLVGASVALPVFNRNQGNILAAQAELARLTAEARQVELKLTERLTQAFQRYETARKQVEAYTRKDGIVDTARESLRLIALAYEKGDAKFDINTFLDAQRTLVQARLSYIQAQADLWRAAIEIAGLLQEEPK
jgi:cobalt-zinc-cadmium efflux system outer membrane protein